MSGTKLRYYNPTNTCDRCIEESMVTNSSILLPGNAKRERDKEGKETGRWLCNKCKAKYYCDMPDSRDNIKKSLANCRIGNQNPNCSRTKGNNSQKLACELYGWEDLNKKYDNYNSPLDCYDHKTGLYHQVQGRYYNSRSGLWSFASFEDEWVKTFEDMVFFCFDKNGKIVERIYKLPWKEIMRLKSITIYKNTTSSYGNPIDSQFEKYRVKDEDELKKANDIWKEIL